MREIIFDTETTGLRAEGDDRLVEIGCIEMIDRMETGRVYHAYCNPQRTMPAEAQAVHGLSDAFLADKPLFADIADELLAFLGTDAALVAHNATFDMGFLNAELKRLGRMPLDRTRMVDTVAIARRLHPGAKHSLDALCSRYGIDRSHRVKHGALLDAELLAQLYIEMHGGRQIGLELGTSTTAADAATTAQGGAPAPGGTARPARPFRPARLHNASAAELERHARFIESLNAPLWADAP
ncbi:MAG: DNA polymerase III subunit epsilon [Sphingopyxis sp.]